MDDFYRRLVEIERRGIAAMRELDAIEAADQANAGRVDALTANPPAVISTRPSGPPAPSFVSTCRVRLISGIHFPMSWAMWNDWNTPDFLRLPQTAGPNTCAYLQAVDNPAFSYPIMQWVDVPYLTENADFVYWQTPLVPIGANAKVRLRKADWSIQGAISTRQTGVLSGIQYLFAINWQKDAVPVERMTAGTHGAATLNRSTTGLTPFEITTISNPPFAPGHVFNSLVEYHDSTVPLCVWGGTNPIIEVDW